LITIGTVSFAVAAPEPSAPTAAATITEPGFEPQTWNNRRNRLNRGRRTVTRTRIIRVRGRIYRETYRITYLPNGRTRTTIIRRVRI
jgi:hypothetical protein